MANNTNTTREIRVALLFFICSVIICSAEKRQYASSVICDRYSLDAIYHEKFHPITDNILADSLEFVKHVTDSMVDSLTTLMADIPDRIVSDSEEKKVNHSFQTLKKAHASKARQSQKNLTLSWEALIASHSDLMLDNDQSSLQDYINKTSRLADAYKYSRDAMDSKLGDVVGFCKETARNGLGGILASVEQDLKKRNKSDSEDPDEFRKRKKLEIAEFIPGFLGTVTTKVLMKDVDLFQAVTTSADGRDSEFDDVIFDLTLIRNRIHSFIRDDLPKNKDSIDLARRSVYIYFAELADEMYKKKIENSKSEANINRKSWDDEELLADALVELMQVYA